MKKNILLLLSAAIFFACSPRKNESKTVGLKGFSAYYNTLFNSKDALETELKNREKAHKDNFYAPYIRLLTTDDQFTGSDMENSAFGQMPMASSPTGASILQISEAKALKAISKYSVLKDGVEKNKMMFDAYLLLAQSRLYQDKPLEALDALNYIFTHMQSDKRIDLAKVYQGVAFTKLKDYYRAGETFLALKNEGVKKDYEKLLTVHYSEMLLESGKREEAVAELEDAFTVNKNRQLRSRIAFLRGQILAQLGKNEEARESFTTAYKLANDFEFEVKSQIEIAKTFNGKNDDYEGAKQYLETIGKKGTYASRKNEFYYALGLMADKAGKPEEASEYYGKALKEKTSDPQIRGLTYYEIGKSHLSKNDYISAGAYYDSALAVMTYDPSREELAVLSKNIKEITKNYYLIKKNDSILALSHMTDPERNAYFSKYIDGIKSKEEAEEIQRKKEGRNKGFETVDFGTNAAFASNNSGSFQDFSSSGKSGFYFANASTVSKGQSEFRQIWGDRSLADNWRYSGRINSIEDVKNEAMGLSTVQNPRRFEPDYYIEQIPTDATLLADLKKSRDTASLGLGAMYERFFSNRPLATKTLYDLVDAKPQDEVRLQALYQIFSMNFEADPAAAQRAKVIILRDYPYTSYAEYVKNPKSTSFKKSTTEVENLYKQAFDLFEKGKYEESKVLIAQAVEKYPEDALVPKFNLLNAFNAGKTAGKEIMILQLEQIALRYSKTSEGVRAKEMLKYLKSDLAEPVENVNPLTPIPAAAEQMDKASERKQVLPAGQPEPDVDAILQDQMRKLRAIDADAQKKKTK